MMGEEKRDTTADRIRKLNDREAETKASERSGLITPPPFLNRYKGARAVIQQYRRLVSALQDNVDLLMEENLRLHQEIERLREENDRMSEFDERNR